MPLTIREAQSKAAPISGAAEMLKEINPQNKTETYFPIVIFQSPSMFFNLVVDSSSSPLP